MRKKGNLTTGKRIKKVTIITLIGFSLFVGCSDCRSPFEPELSPITFELNSGLDEDVNGFYHMVIDTNSWQTIHRISGRVYRDGLPVNVIKFGWASSHYWVVGDNFGYVICNTGLTDYGVYVGYDTTYITWFGGAEVPIVNGSSYSREDGEVNTVIATVKTMVGDTATIFYGYYDNWKEEETYGEFYVIFD